MNWFEEESSRTLLPHTRPFCVPSWVCMQCEQLLLPQWPSHCALHPQTVRPKKRFLPWVAFVGHFSKRIRTVTKAGQVLTLHCRGYLETNRVLLPHQERMRQSRMVWIHSQIDTLSSFWKSWDHRSQKDSKDVLFKRLFNKRTNGTESKTQRLIHTPTNTCFWQRRKKYQMEKREHV